MNKHELTSIPYHESHFHLMELREHEEEVLTKADIDAMVGIGYCNTLIADKKIIALTGFFPMNRGVVQVYVVPSIHLEKYAKSVIKTILVYLDNIAANTPGLRRMQTQSLADDQTDRWMTVLGFRCEGSHPGMCTNGMTYRTWASMVKDGCRSNTF